MFELRKRFRFEASHRLPNHDGKCRRLHGHSWVVEVVVESEELEQGGPQDGMVMDFGDLTSAMKPLLDDYLDHYDLNQSLSMEAPTSERIAQWIYKKLKGPAVPELKAVVVEETRTSKCVYYEV